MSKFAELLTEYVRRSGYSNSRVAQLCMVDRTLFQKYLAGRRIPGDDFPLERLSEFLLLTVEERKQLAIELQKLQAGEDAYNRYQKIRRMFHKFSTIVAEPTVPLMPLPELDVAGLPPATVVNGHADVYLMIRSFLEHDFRDSEGELYLLVQPECQDIMHTVWEIGRRHNITIRHIVCMEQELPGEQQGSYNLDLLEYVFPLFRLKKNYDLRFYYDRIKNHINEMTLFPFLIVTENTMCQINIQGTQAIMTRNKPVVNCYRHRFRDIWENCRPLMTYRMDISSFLALTVQENPGVISVQNAPGLAFCMSEEILNRCLKIEDPGKRADLAREIMKENAEWKARAEAKKVPAEISYFTEEGLRNFLKNGTIYEFSEHLASPLSMDDRRTLMERLCRDMGNGSFEAHLVDEEYKIDEHLVLKKCGDEAVCFIYRQEKNRPMLVLHENSLIRSFGEYLDWLSKNITARTKEETLIRVKEILQEYTA